MRSLGIVLVWILGFSQLLFAEGIDRIEGAWVNNGNTIAITRNQFGWDLWQDNKGRASMELSSDGGGNIKVTFRGTVATVCNYYVTTTNNRSQMVLKLMASNPDSSDARNICIDGTFNRVDTNAVAQVSSDFAQMFKRPDRPVRDGTWSYDITCPGRTDFASSPLFIGGRHAGVNDVFANDLTFGYLSDGRLQVRGFMGKEPVPLDFTMSKGSDGKFTGPGRIGADSCSMTTHYVDDWHMSELLRVPRYSFQRELTSIEIKCGNAWSSTYNNVQFMLGLAGFGYMASDGTPVVAQMRLSYDQPANNAVLYGFLYTDVTTTLNFKISKTSQDESRYYFTGWGTAGRNQNCSIKMGTARY